MGHFLGNKQPLNSILESLDDQAEGLLAEHKIADVLSYGWDDHDTPSSEYVGIAMWQMNPPFQHDWGTLLEGKPPNQCPTTREEFLMGKGEDLMGTMNFSRRALGLALCFAAVCDPKLIEPNEAFRQHYATSTVWLNIASDRLWDFFVMARFNQLKKQFIKLYREKYKEAPPYSAPFKMALEGSVQQQRTCLEALAALADKLQRHRNERNARVHDIATISAQRSVDLLREQRRLAANAGNRSGGVFHDESITSAIGAMKLWYRELVQAISFACEFEYFDRIDTTI